MIALQTTAATVATAPPVPVPGPELPFLPHPGTAGLPMWLWQIVAVIGTIYVFASLYGAAVPAHWRSGVVARRFVADIRGLAARQPTPPPSEPKP
jgi:hypothetical protein